MDTAAGATESADSPHPLYSLTAASAHGGGVILLPRLAAACFYIFRGSSYSPQNTYNYKWNAVDCCIYSRDTEIRNRITATMTGRKSAEHKFWEYAKFLDLALKLLNRRQWGKWYFRVARKKILHWEEVIFIHLCPWVRYVNRQSVTLIRQ